MSLGNCRGGGMEELANETTIEAKERIQTENLDDEDIMLLLTLVDL